MINIFSNSNVVFFYSVYFPNICFCKCLLGAAAIHCVRDDDNLQQLVSEVCGRGVLLRGQISHHCLQCGKWKINRIHLDWLPKSGFAYKDKFSLAKLASNLEITLASTILHSPVSCIMLVYWLEFRTPGWRVNWDLYSPMKFNSLAMWGMAMLICTPAIYTKGKLIKKKWEPVPLHIHKCKIIYRYFEHF